MPNYEGIVALNAKLEIQLWTPNWKHGSKCRIEKNDSERRNWEDMVTLNVELEPWLWMPNYEETVALNAKLKVMAMNAKQKQRLWMPN